MLVISRKRDETIVIGGTIKVMVVDIVGNRVKLGIEGPRETSVHREEIWHKIQRELQEARQ